MKSFLPWLCALGLLGGLIFLHSTNQKLTREVNALREESSQAQTLRTELEQIKTTGSPAQLDQIAQLRNDNQDLLKLRNEVRQLRDDKKQLAQQAQTAQAQVQQVQAQVQAVQSQVQSLATNLQAAQALTAQQQAFAARYGVDSATVQRAAVNACINNLRQIDGAMQQWALENKKTAEAIPTAQDVAAYLKNGVLPKCPAGGTYTINSVKTVPTCSIPGHALPQ